MISPMETSLGISGEEEFRDVFPNEFMDLFLAQEAVPVHAFDQAEPGEPGGHVKIALLAVAQVFDVALHDVETGLAVFRSRLPFQLDRDVRRDVQDEVKDRTRDAHDLVLE